MEKIRVDKPMPLSSFSCGDLETTPIQKGIQKFYVGGFYQGGKYYYWSEDLEELVDYMIHSQNKIIYFHNLDYDIRFFLDYLFENYEIKIIPVHSSILAVKLFNNKKLIKEFRDSYKLIPLSLAKLTESFNLWHVKKDYDVVNNVYPELNKIEKQEYLSYLKTDVLGLYEGLYNFFRLLNVNPNTKKIPITLPSLTLSRWKKTYPKHENINLFNGFDSISRETYFGGRVEVFRRKGKNLFYYDFNSLYPYVMKKYSYPVGKTTKIFCGESKYGISEYPFFIAHCTKIQIPKHYVNPLPVLDSAHGILFYPYGTVRNKFYNSVDLNLLVAYGGSYEWDYAYVWDESDYIFSDYISENYSMKTEAKKNKNKSMYEISKLLMNSLYGKFAQSKNKSIIRKLSDLEFREKYIQGKRLVPYPFTENLYLMECVDRRTPSTTHISSFITANARKELYHVLRHCFSRGNIYYCDTDSIVTDVLLDYDNMKLGFLALEDEIREGYFALPKMYAYVNADHEVVIKAKGLNKDKVKFEDIKSMVEDNKCFSNSSVRISKIKSILNNYKDFTECYDLEKTINPENIMHKRKLEGKYDTMPYKMSL